MTKIIIIAVAAAALVGCQTRVIAEKYPEQVLPIEKVVQINGQDRVIVTSYQIASGGWYTAARSPLYAAEALEGLAVAVETNGSVRLDLGGYRRELSTNSVTMVHEMFSGGAQLITAIGDAYVKIAGGGAQAETVLSVAKQAYSAFTTAGGDPSKASVSTSAGQLTVSDGSVCVSCDADGNCSSCTDAD